MYCLWSGLLPPDSSLHHVPVATSHTKTIHSISNVIIITEKPPRMYEKPWMRRRRIADDKIYRSKKKGVNELLNYIKFTKEAREARDEEWAFTKTDQD